MAQLSIQPSSSHVPAASWPAGLSLRGVSRRYGEHTVVRGLDLDIPAGAFVALLGPSGCGKTTTLRMIAGFEQPDAGEVRLDGALLASPQGQLPPERRHMGMVFQSYALWPHLSVADNVGYPLKLRGVRGADYERRVREALALVQLERRAQAAPQDLSGGQRQRVALARCLVAEPRVILLDEPLANLDRHLRAAMESTFREFHRRTGATFIYVTHDQAEAMALADHVAVMHQGRLVQWATPQQLYAQPRTDWLASFVGQGSVLRQEQNFAGQVVAGPRLCRALQAAGSSAAYPVLVRPEHVRLHGAGEQAATDLLARVHECVFKGERYEVRLALAGGQSLLAYHPRAMAPGAAVGLSIEQAWGWRMRPEHTMAPARVPAPLLRARPGDASRVTLASGWHVEVLSGSGGKQPAAILVRTPHWRLLLDAGAALDPDAAASGRPAAWTGVAAQAPLDAVLISHDHVDHIGAAGLLPADVPLHATPEAARSLPAGRRWRPLPLHGQVVLEKAGAPAIVVRTGANGHSLGGVWLHVAAEGDVAGGLFYSGDVSLESTCFRFDAPPCAEVALLDVSYGSDDTSQAQRRAELAGELRQGPCILPVPATGRALEMALWLQQQGLGPVVMDEACRQALAAALQAPPEQFEPGVGPGLRQLMAAMPAFDPLAPLLLVADPGPDGRPTPFLAAQLADVRRRHRIVYTGYMPPAVQARWRDDAGIRSLRWNVHPRWRDVSTLLRATQARAWLPLFTSQRLALEAAPAATAAAGRRGHHAA